MASISGINHTMQRLLSQVTWVVLLLIVDRGTLVMACNRTCGIALGTVFGVIILALVLVVVLFIVWLTVKYGEKKKSLPKNMDVEAGDGPSGSKNLAHTNPSFQTDAGEPYTTPVQTVPGYVACREYGQMH